MANKTSSSSSYTILLFSDVWHTHTHTVYANESDSRIVELTGQHQQLSFYSFLFILFFFALPIRMSREWKTKKTYMYTTFPFLEYIHLLLPVIETILLSFFRFLLKTSRRCVFFQCYTHTLVCRCLHWRACECVCLFFFVATLVFREKRRPASCQPLSYWGNRMN